MKRQAAPAKRYDTSLYERKLARVMERLSVDKFNWDHTRHGGWVEFWYRDQLYRFDHTVEGAKAAGLRLHFGSDCFCQIVLALEDLARMVERRIYDLGTWVAGMKALPPAVELPECVQWFGFDRMPAPDEVKAEYRRLCKVLHPDCGGSNADFVRLRDAYERAMQVLGVEP